MRQAILSLSAACPRALFTFHHALPLCTIFLSVEGFALLCRPSGQHQGQQAVSEDCCAWELLQLFYILAPRLEGIVTQVRSAPFPPL